MIRSDPSKPPALLPLMVKGKGRTMADYTADEIAEGIALAIKAGDTEAVHSLMVQLALVDAQRAQDVLDTIAIGLRAAERRARPPHQETNADG